VKDKGFIIIGNDSSNSVWAFGTSSGKPFSTERAAESRKREFERVTVGLDFLVIPLQEMVPVSKMRLIGVAG
jgi:hypothetical protein